MVISAFSGWTPYAADGDGRLQHVPTKGYISRVRRGIASSTSTFGQVLHHVSQAKSGGFGPPEEVHAKSRITQQRFWLHGTHGLGTSKGK